jgi:hypothetical protein
MRWRIEEYLKAKASEFVSAEEFAEWLSDNRLLDFTSIRNTAIREHYRALPMKNRFEAKMQTADYFCLSEAQTHRILFDRRYRKK